MIRIAPIEKPKGIFRTVMYYLLKKEFGKTIMPAKVIYSRYPQIGMLVKKLYDVESTFKRVSELDKLLIQNLVATLNGCSFCIDISMKKSMNRNLGMQKFGDLMAYKSSDVFTEKEKAIFHYVEEMTSNIVVSDATYNKLQSFCSDEEIIEITYVAASENYLNRLIKPLNIGSDALCEIK